MQLGAVTAQRLVAALGGEARLLAAEPGSQLAARVLEGPNCRRQRHDRPGRDAARGPAPGRRPGGRRAAADRRPGDRIRAGGQDRHRPCQRPRSSRTPPAGSPWPGTATRCARRWRWPAARRCGSPTGGRPRSPSTPMTAATDARHRSGSRLVRAALSARRCDRGAPVDGPRRHPRRRGHPRRRDRRAGDGGDGRPGRRAGRGDRPPGERRRARPAAGRAAAAASRGEDR